MTFNHGNDPCLSLWAAVYAQGSFNFRACAKVLEIGAAEADWITPMITVRPDLQMTSLDWRGCTRPGTCLRGNVLTYDFPPASFDAIVGISSIEHIGLGHYEDDPLDVDGDTHCLQRAATWLKPGGFVYLDVPYDPTHYWVKGSKCRIYDEAAVRARLVPDGLQLVYQWYAAHGQTDRLIDAPTTPDATHFHYTALLLTKAA